jgi:hypothetical protein
VKRIVQEIPDPSEWLDTSSEYVASALSKTDVTVGGAVQTLDPTLQSAIKAGQEFAKALVSAIAQSTGLTSLNSIFQFNIASQFDSNNVYSTQSFSLAADVDDVHISLSVTGFEVTATDTLTVSFTITRSPKAGGDGIDEQSADLLVQINQQWATFAEKSTTAATQASDVYYFNLLSEYYGLDGVVVNKLQSRECSTFDPSGKFCIDSLSTDNAIPSDPAPTDPTDPTDPTNPTEDENTSFNTFQALWSLSFLVFLFY